MQDTEFKSQPDVNSINASEVAAFIAVIASGFLFTKFWLTTVYKSSIISNHGFIEKCNFEIDKAMHLIDYRSIIITFTCFLISIMLMYSKDNIVNYITKLILKPKYFSKKCKIVIYCISSIFIISMCFLLLFNEQLANYIINSIFIVLIFIIILIITIQLRPTKLAFCAALYLSLCFLISFMFLLLKEFINASSN